MNTMPQVLVVEDEPILLQFVVQALRAGGCRASGVESAEEALAACAGGGYDLVVSDVVLPGLSGPELACRLWERHPGLPVLFMTGQEPEILDVYGLPDGDVIEKPFDVSRFLARVRLALGAGVP